MPLQVLILDGEIEKIPAFHIPRMKTICPQAGTTDHRTDDVAGTTGASIMTALRGKRRMDTSPATQKVKPTLPETAIGAVR
ncbi:hypothetical protein BD311DRAFT_769900 [Dichomitus squalens]|uniref:Uncharacterized protein n=1 Tax=Dichomitus squalens TaxID=114155 RepID=A0A4Q9M9T5_9APHY|nr:hypothetical protein BD311DRAFT_769900 [Dichomitus squalens]